MFYIENKNSHDKQGVKPKPMLVQPCEVCDDLILLKDVEDNMAPGGTFWKRWPNGYACDYCLAHTEYNGWCLPDCSICKVLDEKNIDY